MMIMMIRWDWQCIPRFIVRFLIGWISRALMKISVLVKDCTLPKIDKKNNLLLKCSRPFNNFMSLNFIVAAWNSTIWSLSDLNLCFNKSWWLCTFLTTIQWCLINLLISYQDIHSIIFQRTKQSPIKQQYLTVWVQKIFSYNNWCTKSTYAWSHLRVKDPIILLLHMLKIYHKSFPNICLLSSVKSCLLPANCESWIQKLILIVTVERGMAYPSMQCGWYWRNIHLKLIWMLIFYSFIRYHKCFPLSVKNFTKKQCKTICTFHSKIIDIFIVTWLWLNQQFWAWHLLRIDREDCRLLMVLLRLLKLTFALLMTKVINGLCEPFTNQKNKMNEEICTDIKILDW